MKSKIANTRTGVTLVESLVVIGILGLLLSLLVPAIQNIRAAAGKIQCLNNLRQIGIALQCYHGDYQHFPPQRFELNSSNLPQSRSPDYLLSWRVLITPYLERDEIIAQASKEIALNWRSYQHSGKSVVISTFACPLDSRLTTPQANEDGVLSAFSSYLGVIGSGAKPRDGMFGYPRNGPGFRIADAVDGSSNTLLVGERAPPDSWSAGQWYANIWYFKDGENNGPDHAINIQQVPYGDASALCGTSYYGPGRMDNICDKWHFWSLHPRGANFLFVDGSAHLLPYTMKDGLNALATRNGGELPVDLD